MLSQKTNYRKSFQTESQSYIVPDQISLVVKDKIEPHHREITLSKTSSRNEKVRGRSAHNLQVLTSTVDLSINETLSNADSKSICEPILSPIKPGSENPDIKQNKMLSNRRSETAILSMTRD